jgi:hypothetical protein
VKAVITSGRANLKMMVTLGLSCAQYLLFIHLLLSDFPCSFLAKDARGIFPFLVMFL